MSDFNITLFETCELLNKSKKSISRYIRRDLLHPQRIKSQQGTLEYRFNKADIEAFKRQEALKADETRPDRTDQTGHKEPIKKTEFLENKDFKGQTDETRQDTQEQTRQDTPEETGQSGQPEPTETNFSKKIGFKTIPRQDRTEETRQDSEVITLLKETTGLLKDQLVKKDEQIKDLGGKIDQLIERDRETNILIGQLQSKVLMLEQPKETIISDITEETGQDTPDEAGQDEPVKPLEEKEAETPEKKGFLQGLFNKTK